MGSGDVYKRQALEDTPELLNDSPYDDGWIFELELGDDADIESLMSAEDYRESIADEDWFGVVSIQRTQTTITDLTKP